MANIRPFQALRPLPASVAEVAAVPYDVVNTEEARGLAEGHPLSFLHVSRSEIDLPESTDPYSEIVYEKAQDNFNKLRATAPLISEESPAVYFYRLRMGKHEQIGLAAGYSLDEYDQDLIKKHERTRQDKEDDRTRHIIKLRAQTGPVFLVYRASNAIDQIADKITKAVPLFDFEAVDGIRHTVWPVTGADLAHVIKDFAALPGLYIADGHHRAASAARARKNFSSQAPADSNAEIHWMLAVAFPDNQCQILPYNRAVKDLAGQTPEQLIAALKNVCEISEGGPNPRQKGEVSMYLAGKWYTLRLKPVKDGGSVGNTLDVSLLQDQVLAPLLKIGDPRTDKRIDFVGGIRGFRELERLVHQGKAAVAFSMVPVSVNDLMRIADAGEIMPPKSTWFEPKLRDALLIHMI
jgi:uncharacterized protein (DUF1015 family)